ncbi:NRPS protein [Claviceps maximensis]|nr:NRPS protein [Claviceps maximensis]
MASSIIMSPSDVGESTLADVAKSCNTSPAAIEDIYECTPTQTAILAQKKPDIYQIVLSLDPDLSLERWREAFRLVISRNATLRTRFSKIAPGKIVQVVLKLEETEDDIILLHQCDDTNEFSQKRSNRSSQQWLGQPLFQAVFVGSKFIAVMHHGVMDYWSWNTLFTVDIAAAYFGLQIPDRPPFKDFVRYCNAIDESSAENFWQQRCRGVAACFPVASDSDTVASRISKGVVREIRFQPGALGDVVRSQMPSYIEAAWSITSSIYTASDSVAYGYLISGRTSCLKELQNTLGPLFSEVPVQVDLRRDLTVGQLVKGRSVALKQLQRHPAVHWGLHKIRAAIQANSNAMGYGTLLNILPEHADSPAPTSPSDVETDDDHGPRVELDGKMSFEACFPLYLIFELRHDGFNLDPRLDPGAISESHLNLVLDQFEHVLRLLIQAPSHTKLSSLNLLNDSDRARISAWNSKLAPEKTANSTVHAEFRAQVRVRQDATAIDDASQGIRVDYHALDRMSDQLAKLLRCRGISRNVAVCLVSEPSMWAIVAMLGIMKAGGIFVPVDRNTSRENKAAICSKVQARLVLTSTTQQATCVGLATDILVVTSSFINEAPARTFMDQVEPESCSTDTALLLFTRDSASRSGAREPASGIMYAHHALVVSSRSQAKSMGWQAGCRVLHSAEYVSGWSVCEVLGTLLSGGCICIPSVKNHSLSEIPQEAQTDWRIVGPRALSYMSAAVSKTCQHSILCMGDPRWFIEWTARSTSTNNRLMRGWGTSESCFISTIADVATSCSEELEDECIGFSIGSCSTWIVSTHNVHDLAPVGSMGELLLSGASVAQGYWADDAKTANAFISPPRWAASFARDTGNFYRTGYLARYRTNGCIALVGKRSNRIKVRGHTVQLEQLERALGRHCDQLRDVACSTQIRAGRTQVVALVCLADPRLPSEQILQRVHDSYQGVVDQHIAVVRDIAASKLPAAVVPSIWHAVERLPWLDHGDLDRHRIRQWLK